MKAAVGGVVLVGALVGGWVMGWPIGWLAIAGVAVAGLVLVAARRRHPRIVVLKKRQERP